MPFRKEELIVMADNYMHLSPVLDVWGFQDHKNDLNAVLILFIFYLSINAFFGGVKQTGCKVLKQCHH